jgi:hypothetical protein
MSVQPCCEQKDPICSFGGGIYRPGHQSQARHLHEPPMAYLRHRSGRHPHDSAVCAALLLPHPSLHPMCSGLIPHRATHCSRPFGRYIKFRLLSSRVRLSGGAWRLYNNPRILLLASGLGGQGSNEPPLYALICFMKLGGEVCSGLIPLRATHCSHLYGHCTMSLPISPTLNPISRRPHLPLFSDTYSLAALLHLATRICHVPPCRSTQDAAYVALGIDCIKA